MRGGPNGLGSVASVLSGGSVSAAYSYTPWGEASGAGELPFVGYNSEEHAGGTGLQYLRARFYDAASAAFPTADSYLGDPSDPSSLNRYAYCGGNPVAFSDPSGNERFSSQKQRNSWLKSNSAASKKRQSSAGKPAPQSKALAPNGSLGARNLIFKAKDTPLYSAKVNKALPPATSAPVLNRSQDTWRGAVVKAGGVSQITYSHKNSADYATDGSYGAGSGGSLFGAVGDFFSGAVSYASRQVQAVRDHVCGAAGHIADQLGFDLPDLSDVAHGALDVLGFVPGLGTAADVANGILYAAEGNWGDAIMSFVSAVPVVGDGAKAASMTGKVAGNVIGLLTSKSAKKVLNKVEASKPPTVIKQNKSGSLRAERHQDGTVDLVLKRKDVWDADQMSQANKKADALTEGKTVKTEVGKRDSGAISEFKKKAGGKAPEGYDVDHIIDLQLGGADDISNMWFLDRSVNRSMGAQINYLIKDLPPGTKIGSVRFE